MLLTRQLLIHTFRRVPSAEASEGAPPSSLANMPDDALRNIAARLFDPLLPSNGVALCSTCKALRGTLAAALEELRVQRGQALLRVESPTASSPPPPPHCLLPIASSPLPPPRCLLPTASSPLPPPNCLLPTGRLVACPRLLSIPTRYRSRGAAQRARRGQRAAFGPAERRPYAAFHIQAVTLCAHAHRSAEARPMTCADLLREGVLEWSRVDFSARHAAELAALAMIVRTNGLRVARVLVP